MEHFDRTVKELNLDVLVMVRVFLAGGTEKKHTKAGRCPLCPRSRVKFEQGDSGGKLKR